MGHLTVNGQLRRPGFAFQKAKRRKRGGLRLSYAGPTYDGLKMFRPYGIFNLIGTWAVTALENVLTKMTMVDLSILGDVSLPCGSLKVLPRPRLQYTLFSRQILMYIFSQDRPDAAGSG